MRRVSDCWPKFQSTIPCAKLTVPAYSTSYAVLHGVVLLAYSTFVTFPHSLGLETRQGGLARRCCLTDCCMGLVKICPRM